MVPGEAPLERRGIVVLALLERLADARPGDAVLSEESKDDLSRVDADRVWIIDPVDGTREYGLGDRPDWAVHVALWSAGELVAGAVALPAQNTTLSTPEVAAPRPFDGPPRVVVSRTRPPAVALAVREALDGTLVEMGSAGAKVAAVIRGVADVYVHAGGQYEWDQAAPVGVALAAGLHASRLDGTPLRIVGPRLAPGKHVARVHFGIHAGLAHAAGDQLGDLRTVVENEDALVHGDSTGKE